MSPEERIAAVSLEAMMEMSLERLIEERNNLRNYVEEAIELAEEMMSIAIAEKLKQKALN